MIKLELKVEEVQLILNALANLPYAQVKGLVELVVGQTELQLKEQKEKEKEEAKQFFVKSKKERKK